MFGWKLGTGALLLAFVVSACGAASSPTAAPPSATPVPSPSDTALPSPVGARYALGEFPAFPDGSFPQETVSAFQAVLDSAVRKGTFPGLTAAVIVADLGSWTGTAGSWDGIPLTLDARHPTHSSAKTVVAAQVLRLVEDGKLVLDDLASDHLPPELAFYDANGATIRQVLAMRSGIPGLNEEAGYYPAEQASTVVEVFKMLGAPSLQPDTLTEYASTNYVLLGAIIEHTTGKPLAEAVRSDVLAHPGLDGLTYTVGSALASDGWGVETTSATLARWGYELYGGTVISPASLREMITFHGFWYGLGVMNFSSEFHDLAVGHQGQSSVTTCCSAIIVVALPEKGIVVAVQANTIDNDQVNRLAGALLDAARKSS